LLLAQAITALNQPALGMNRKATFLRKHTRGHLGLNPALDQVLSEAPPEAALNEYRLHLVEQLVA
jgi:hypothetical protein